ncbi:hypothetical protein [Streptosporangium lutulentum]|uniref:Uncharacterized protein n=1 Tax=Streptosporangium lutulentum TaxID=1461250 RepID=A0ABT9Q2J7_9ACTN|nr:hypothetical protein [Streptosporangium lutulentum]MDP9840960.1 hypothetical protein [Streptosporangium lutulentum]
MLRNLFLGVGTLFIFAGLFMVFFDPLVINWSASGTAVIAAPTSVTLVELIKPALLVLAGVGMMVGGLAAATTDRGKDASGGGTSAPG